MLSDTAHDETGHEVPTCAVTSGRESPTMRLIAKVARLLCLPCGPGPSSAGLSGRGRAQVVRAYHAANLAKARAASEELVRAGFHTGDLPYGYRAQRVRVRPAGQRPRWRTRLIIEPVEASTVRMIFVWRGEDRLPLGEIRQRLMASRYPAPLDLDTDQPGVWTVALIRSILRNPKYLGRQVWGRTHHGKPLPRSEWVWSAAWVHPPIVTPDEFSAANPRFRFPHSTASAADVA